MRRFLAACCEMLSLWLWPHEWKRLETWSVVWSPGAPEAACRDLGSRGTLEAGRRLLFEEGPSALGAYGGVVYLMDPDCRVAGWIAGPPPRTAPWIHRVSMRSPN